MSLTQADGMVLTDITHSPGLQVGRREEKSGQCCQAPCPVHMLSVCLEPQCHQVLCKNVRALSNIDHPHMGPHMYGTNGKRVLMFISFEPDLVGKRQKAPGQW